jgi:hypothetical protein
MFIDYIVANKEWVFSGIGVLILGSLCGLVWRYVTRRAAPPHHGQVTIVQVLNDRPPQSPPQLSAQIQSPITRISPITMREITKAIENAPPLQREDVAKHYEGITVQWETRLFSAAKKEKDNVRLSLDFDEGTSLVICTVRLSNYSELGVLPKGAPITVIGRISKVDSKYVELEDTQLLFHAAR